MRLLTVVLTCASLWGQAKEAALGARLAQEMHSRSTSVDNVAVRNYVGQLGQKLAGGASYNFRVIADRPIGRTYEPTALPGGYVFVSVDLILAARDEAEFAGMLAHAMAHSVAPLATPQPIAIGGIPLVFMANGDSGIVPLSQISIRRAAELDADRIAVQTMAAAGYDPASLVRYIERMQPAGNPLFSTLPPRAGRIAALQQAIAQLPPRTYTMNQDFARIQDAVRMPRTPVAHVPTLYRPDEVH